jgi:hypothetical protein
LVEICDCSFLRHSGFAHTFITAFALSQKSRIVAWCDGTEARGREDRIERKPSLGCSPRFIMPTDMRESGGKAKMR